MAAVLDTNAHDTDNGLSEYHDAAVNEFRQELGFDADGPTEQNYPSWNPDPVPVKDVDEEVQIKKKRKPVAKLDEARLLSADGIPRLRKIAKSRKVQFKGKGHEYSDIAYLLSTYQFWLDDLYPRAKFRDALAMVEKLGHSKRMLVTRRAWIDATKPQGREASPERLEDEMAGIGNANGHADVYNEGNGNGPNNDAVMHEAAGGNRSNDMGEDDDLDALLAEHETGQAPQRSLQRPRHNGPFEQDDNEDGPDEDELDALMAEQSTTQETPGLPTPSRRINMPFYQDEEEDSDQDELDALLAKEDEMSGEVTKTAPKAETQVPQADVSKEDGPDDEELDALMAEQDQTTPNANPGQITLNSSQTVSVGEDELDALMDEHEAINS